MSSNAPPSAELRHDQKDSDSLPEYDVLDAILELFIEDNLSVDEIAARGFDRATVGRVLEMVKRNEYKRRQAPPGCENQRPGLRSRLAISDYVGLQEQGLKAARRRFCSPELPPMLLLLLRLDLRLVQLRVVLGHHLVGVGRRVGHAQAAIRLGHDLQRLADLR